MADNVFSSFDFKVAKSRDELEACYRLRYMVYCEEKSFEPCNNLGLEYDEFDDIAIHCMVVHRESGELAATARIVMPHLESHSLPMEVACSESMTGYANIPSQFNRSTIGEFSRLTVSEKFRKVFRQSPEQHRNGSTDTLLYSRYMLYALIAFVFITANQRGIKQVFLMTEPKVARLVKLMGIELDVIGDIVNYHGRRRAYATSTKRFIDNLPNSVNQLKHRLLAIVNSLPELNEVHYRHILTQMKFNTELKEARAA